MQNDPIKVDETPRGWFNRLCYPVCLVQVFRPCPWSQLRDYLCEGEYFRDEIFKDRIAWLEDSKLKHNIRYDSVEEDLEESSPRVYRIFVEFTCTADAIAYKQRWK